MEDGVDVTRRNLIEFTDTEQAHEDEDEDTEVMGPPKKTRGRPTLSTKIPRNSSLLTV
jgi:hypothetical protein